MALGKHSLNIGKTYIAELDHLNETPLTAEELAALVFQGGQISERLGRLTGEHATQASLSMLPQYLRPCFVEGVALKGGGPVVCANVRRRQAELYFGHLAIVRVSIISGIGSVIETARNSGQWWWWAAEHTCLLRARYCFAMLYSLGLLYSMGARVHPAKLIRRLQLLCDPLNGDNGIA